MVLITIYIFTDTLFNFFDAYITDKWSVYYWSTFTSFEYLVFTYILWSQIKKLIVKRIIVIASILFILFSAVYNLLTNFKSFDSIPIGVETILIFVYSFYYLYEEMKDTSTLLIYNKHQFWITIGFLVYLAGSFFIFIFANIVEDAALLRQYWFITNSFYVVMNILFAVGFLLKVKESKEASLKQLNPYLNNPA